jgi:RiboL-PSP-HEPN
MLSAQIQILEKRIAAIEIFLHLYDFKKRSAEIQDADMQSILAAAFPTGMTTEDRAFRHCAIVTNLYAIYEHFVETALSYWLSIVPRYYRFSALPETFKNKYRNGISQVVRDIQRRQFDHLSLAFVIETYHKSLIDDHPWQFVHEALTIHATNLRRAEIDSLFGSAGLPNFWNRIEDDLEVKSKAELIDTTRNADKLLAEFVNYRNDASHGVVDELLGPQPLNEWTVFIKAICHAVNRAVTQHILLKEKEYDKSCTVGRVTEKFKNNIVVIKMKSAKNIKLGDRPFFLSSKSHIVAQILSIQINGKPEENVVAPTDDFEVGLKLSEEVPKGADVITMAV